MMNKCDSGKRKRGNKGFSLVELLVAMSILAIIVAPLLHTFVTASRANSKARKLMQATTLAQNVMEKVKAYKLEDICRDMNRYGGAAPIDEQGGSVLADLSSLGSFSFEAYPDPSDDTILHQVGVNTGVNGTVNLSAHPSSVVHVLGPDASGAGTIHMATKFRGQRTEIGGSSVSEYRFVLGGLSVQNSGNTYDALVTMTADPSSSIAQISSMNQNDSAFFVENPTDIQDVVSEYWKRFQNYASISGNTTTVEDDFYGLLTRKVEVRFDGQTVEVKRGYSVPSGYTHTTDQSLTETRLIYNALGSTGEELRSIYIYYYPLYGTYLNQVRDQFVVENTSGREITVYLIKMMDASQYSFFNEENYKMNLQVKDYSATTPGQPADQTLTTLCTNIRDGQMNQVNFNTILDNTDRNAVKDLGNSSDQYIKYNVTVKIFTHEESNFTLAADASTGIQSYTFRSGAAKELVSFDYGSMIDSSTVDK